MKRRLAEAGFTIVELMVALGIAGAVAVMIMGIQTKSQLTTKESVKNQQINELIQRLNAELTKYDVCKRNFQGATISSTAPGTALDLYTPGGGIILKKKTSESDFVDNMRIDSIYALKSGSKITLTISYTYRNVIDYVLRKEDGTIIKNPLTSDSFTVGINVFSKPLTPDIIESCFTDTNDALIQAVKYSCQGKGSFYENETTAPPYGRCSHKIEMQNSAGAIVPSFTCPNGEMLTAVQMNPSGNANDNRRILKCSKLATNNKCLSWEYMKGIDSNGNAVCESILNLFTTGNGLLVGSGTGGYGTIASVICPPGQILQSIGANFASPSGCIDPSLNVNCPTPGQYIDKTNPDGTITCKGYPDNNSCAAGNYATAINSVGVVSCGVPALSGSCTGTNVVNGTTAGGAVTCTAIPN